MNRQIEFITFPYSRAKFSIFSLTKKNVECFKCRIISNKKYDSRNMSLSNKLPSRTSCLPTDPTSILSFLVNRTKKAEKIRTMRHAMRRCDAATPRQTYRKTVSWVLQTCINIGNLCFNYSECVEVLSNDLKMLVFSLFISV